MDELSPIAKKIKEAYLQGARHAHAERGDWPQEKMERASENEAHRKAEELYISDEEIEENFKVQRLTGLTSYLSLQVDKAKGAKWLCDRLFKLKNEE